MISRALRNSAVASFLLVLLIVAPAAATGTFRPRIGRALGLVPPAGSTDVAIGSAFPEVYHGGSVLTHVTVHTIFWAPAGYSFTGSPSTGVLGYVPLIQQFFTDAAHDSGSTGNLFSILDQYGDMQGAGSYDISYNAAADSIADTDAFPVKSNQCASPSGVATCVTDQEVIDEIDKVIQRVDPGDRDFHDLWEIFLPPNVDECITAVSCGTNSFAGYHSLGDAGHGEFFYAVIIDTLIEVSPTPGADPEGNPEAESAIDTAAHETVEAITDPEGAGWMDSNGNEVADKCENGLQQGTPLGHAADGSLYDQVINGHEYDIQTMWSDTVMGCVQESTTTSDGLPLPSVSLRQFSPIVSGSAGTPIGGAPVRIILLRASSGTIVASATTGTRADGSWGPVELSSGGRHPLPHAPGDDRDVVLLEYDSSRVAPQLIATGSGGNPFNEAGWTGWLDLDTGASVASHSISIAPCFQTGVLALTINGAGTSAPPLSECSASLGQTTVSSSPITDGSVVTLSSEDNRAVSALAPGGGLVKLTVALGEPGSVSAVGNSQILFSPSGIPACTGDLRAQVLTCSGLVPGARYTLTRARGHAVRSARAGAGGAIRIGGFPGSPPVARGDRFELRNRAGRTLTVLHVADLRVDIEGEETVVASGTCQPGDYWGAPLTSLPASASVGVGGAAGTGTICPLNGRADGMSDAVIAQTDDLSGGLTETTVPLLVGTAPANDAIVSGGFTALAQTGLAGPNGSVLPAGGKVSLAIRNAGGRPVYHAANVATASGALVAALPAGVYRATWVLSDRNGDTRTMTTTFVEQ